MRPVLALGCVVGALALALAGGAGAAPRCSASGLRPTAQRSLPAPVARMRSAILAAAVRCDYRRLARLAGRTFTFSFGGGRDAAAHWRALEAAGEPVLARLVRLLELPATRRGTIWSWPPAYRDRPTRAHWRQLERVYPRAQVARWRREGVYYGLRAGITRSGDWLFLVAGD